MLQVPLYNQDGQIIGQQKLSPAIWNIEPKTGLVHEAVRIQDANARRVLATAKGRGEVRGGGKKPWRQKGTGRARHGSIRSPLWKGGGVTFGPSRERNYTLKINKQVKRKALFMSLSDKVLNNRLVIIDKIEPKEKKTKDFVAILKKMPIKDNKFLIALSKEEKDLGKIGRNIPNIGMIGCQNLNIKDLLKYPVLLITLKGVNEIEKIYNRT